MSGYSEILGYSERVYTFKIPARFISDRMAKHEKSSRSLRDKFTDITAGKSYEILSHICAESYIVDDAGAAVHISEDDMRYLKKIEKREQS